MSYGYDRLKQTGDFGSRKKTHNQWFEIQDSISYWEDFSKQKIVYREISDNMNACILAETIFVNNKCYIITGEKLFYLLGFLNSKLFNRIILQSANITGGKGHEFLSKIKIPKLESDKLVIFEKLIVEICDTSDPIRIQNLDHQINKFVYQIYDFTSREVDFIEN